MCVVSMVTDHYREKWQQSLPQTSWPTTTTGGYVPTWQLVNVPLTPQIPQAEVDEFKRLLERAREYDARNNEPHCELQAKKDALLAIAAALGVKIDFL